jgi:putative transposase
VKTLMKRMGIEALYRRPRTTKPEPGHKIYPYLLRDLEITRPNQVWAMDITYIPMSRGFVYLAVVLDWFSRRLLAWRLSVTMEASFCVEALEDALAHHGKQIVIPIRARSSPGWPSLVSSLCKASPSAWMAKALGETMCLSSACGAPSNTRRYICGPMKASVMHALRLAAIYASKKKLRATNFPCWQYRKHGSRRRSA